MKLEISAQSINESFARSTVAAFAAQVNPTLDEINDIKTAVSEAVTNCVVHAYKDKGDNMIKIECELYADHIQISITDRGKGIKDIQTAIQPFVTDKLEDERSGMGFTVMQSFMDSVNVQSKYGEGTTVTMQKIFESRPVGQAKAKRA